MTNTTLPPAKTSSSYQFLLVKSEMTVVISDLPLNWKSSNSGNLNDIPTVANNWGWNSIQQFSPSNYDTGKNYLEQPCEAVASMIAKADAEDDLKTATIHVWVSMTDIINYAKVRGGGSSFSVKDSCPEINSYFMSCFQKLYDAGRGKKSIIININAEGEFLSCQDTPKFKRVTKEIVNELRGEGYMVSWGGPLWRELFPFVDAHGRIKAKGRGDKVVAVAVMEKQLYREKTLLKCMFSSERVNELDHKATLSGIAKHEGLIDEPPEEYRYEDVSAIPLDPNSRLGRGSRKVRAKMHVPNWDNQPKASYQPSIVLDDKYFWIKVDHGQREENEDDPMGSISGFCDSCAISKTLDKSEYPCHKDCPNCSANYTLRSFGEFTETCDRKLRIFLAHRSQQLYEGDEDWALYDPSTDLKGFMKMTIRVLLNTELGKAISQYGFVRMHPSAAATLMSTSRGHLIVTTRFKKTSSPEVYFRFSYDMGNKLYAAYAHALFSQEFIKDTFGHENPKEEKLGDAIEVILGLMEIWDSVPQCIPPKLSNQKMINEIRRGIECSLIHFCSIGENKMSSKNRKITNRKGISEDIPDEITGISPELNYCIPEDEGAEDFSTFTELLEEAEEEPEDEEDAEMVYSSEEDVNVEPDEPEKTQNQDEPMDGTSEDGPEAKRRKVAKMIESIPSMAIDEGVCLACGEIGHTMPECPHQEDVNKVSGVFEMMLSKLKVSKASFPKTRRTQEKKKERSGKMDAEDKPQTVTILYPEEVSAFVKSAEFQGGNRTVMGKDTSSLGPDSNDVIVYDILPEMGEISGVYQATERMSLSKEEEAYYANIEELFPVGTLAVVPMDGTMYLHEQFDDERYLSRYDKTAAPMYPRKDSGEYKAGYQLNKILRHHIGKAGNRATNHETFRCNEGAWVLLEDLIEQDFLWYDACDYGQARRHDQRQFLEIKRRRTGLIVDLAVAESRRWGKCRFQILGLRVDSYEEFRAVKEEFQTRGYRVKDPPERTNINDGAYDGWILPVAVRATSGHSYKRKNEVGITLDPTAMMRKLDMNTAMKLEGAYHVTSPSYLESIIVNGLMPGGTTGKRIMNYFGIFPPWDERNRVTRTRSPVQSEVWMLVIYVPPTELTRFEAGVSGTGDILVPMTIPPEEIREMWITRKCAAKEDNDGIMRWVITNPRKIYSKQLVHEIVTYADYQKLAIPGFIASRAQVIDDAIQLVKKFPKAPVGDPEDLIELKKDLEILEEDRGKTLRLEDEVRYRVVMKLTMYFNPSQPRFMRMPDRKCPCCLQETPSFLAICLYCNAEFWSAGRYERIVPETAAPKNRWDRDRINRNTKDAMKKAQEAFEQMSPEEKTKFEKDEKEIREKVEEMEQKGSKTEQTKKQEQEASFAKEEPKDKKEEKEENQEDLSMFDRNLKLPEEGAFCIDSNLQTAKYILVHLMKRINKGLPTWWKFNVSVDREEKLRLWAKGYRPDITGPDFPVKEIDPATGEPVPLDNLEYLDRLRNNNKFAPLIEPCEHIALRGYQMIRFIHQIRWAIYRIGMSREDVEKMIDHNKIQTENQKARRAMLGRSGGIVEAVIIQNDPTFTLICKLIKLVTGCDTFSLLSPVKPRGNCYHFDVEALVGDPINQEVDQEITLILYTYGFDQIYGKNGDLLRNLLQGRSKLARQLVENENYQRSIPQLKFETKVSQPEQEKPGSHPRLPRPESRAKADFEQPSRPPTVFGPGGKTYETANDDPMGRPEVDLKPRSGRSEDVGATAKAHAAKARPSTPEPKAMPDPPRATPRQPPNPPPSPRNQPGKGSRTTYIDDSDTTNDPSQSSQTPINPNQGEKGSGKKGGRKGSKGGYQQPNYQNRGKGGWGRRHQTGWDYYGWTYENYINS